MKKMLIATLLIFSIKLYGWEGEIKLEVTTGASLSFTLTKMDNIYNNYYLNNGFSINTSSAYNNSQTNTAKSIIKFDFGTDTNADFKILHSLYKLKRGSSYIKIDWRDCDYSTPYTGVDPYYTHDVYLKYNPTTGGFSVKNETTGIWRNLSNGETVNIWGDGRKRNSTHPNSCFGIPDEPTNLWHEVIDVGGTRFPKLRWTEPSPLNYDYDGFQIWRQLHNASWWAIDDIGDQTYYIDSDVIVLSPNKLTARYKVKTRDWGNLYSLPSNERIVVYNDVNFSSGQNNELAEIKYLNDESNSDFVLYPVYPNPFNPNTKISFEISEPSNVNLTIYNVIGEIVDLINLNNLNAGLQSFGWSGDNIPSGMYFLYLEAKGINTGKVYSANSKMHLLK